MKGVNMLKLVGKFLLSRVGLEALGAVIVSLVTMFLFARFSPVPVRVVQTAPTVQTIYVDKPVITERVVEQVIKDPKDQAIIKELMRENTSLKASVTGLSVTVARLETGGGTNQGGTIVPPGPPPPALVDGAAVPLPSEPLFTFKDWQLTAQYNASTFIYSLDQKFNVYTISGRDRDGSRVSIVQLFQLDANGNRVFVPSTTTAVETDATEAHWMLSPKVQAGIAATFHDNLTETGGIVGLQWLRRGKTKATEDSSLAIATPSAFLTKSIREFGVLPISYNLGQIPHFPLTNTWVSPYIGLTDSSFNKRIGIVLSATF